jgi:hypothetical protein
MKAQAEGYIDPRRAAVTAAYLAALPGTQKQIASKAGIANSTVAVLTPILHGPKMHIGGWTPHPRSGPPSPIYFAGVGEDVPENVPRLTRKEIHDRYDARIKGTEEAEIRRKTRSTRKWLAKAKAAPNTWLAILGVRASVNGEG